MVQDLCFFLQRLGVSIDGIGTTTLKVQGVREIRVDVDYQPSEDPIEAMSLLAAAVVTDSAITIRRVPIEFLEIELATLETMGMQFTLTPEYTSANGHTRLVDLTTIPGPLKAPIDKIHPMPFPGLNIDNLPFFALIAAKAEGTTMIHDWVYDNRAIYLTELTKVGATVLARSAPGDDHWPDAQMARRRSGACRRCAPVSSCSSRCSPRPAPGAAQRLCHQPRLRGPRGAAQCPRRHRGDLPRHLSAYPPVGAQPPDGDECERAGDGDDLIQVDVLARGVGHPHVPGPKCKVGMPPRSV